MKQLLNTNIMAFKNPVSISDKVLFSSMKMSGDTINVLVTDNETGELIVDLTLHDGTNNIGEYIALSMAVDYAQESGHVAVITSSQTACHWMYKKKISADIEYPEFSEAAADFALCRKSDADKTISGKGFFDFKINGIRVIQVNKKEISKINFIKNKS